MKIKALEDEAANEKEKRKQLRENKRNDYAKHQWRILEGKNTPEEDQPGVKQREQSGGAEDNRLTRSTRTRDKRKKKTT